MTTFAPDNESRNRLVAQNRVIFKAIYSRILSPERSPNRNPDFSQSSASPLHKEILQFFPKIRKIFESCNFFRNYFTSKCKVFSMLLYYKK